MGRGAAPGIFRVNLDEMTWRFNNRKNPFLFRDTMLKLIHSDNLEYKKLTKAILFRPSGACFFPTSYPTACAPSTSLRASCGCILTPLRA